MEGHRENSQDNGDQRQVPPTQRSSMNGHQATLPTNGDSSSASLSASSGQGNNQVTHALTRDLNHAPQTERLSAGQNQAMLPANGDPSRASLSASFTVEKGQAPPEIAGNSSHAQSSNRPVMAEDQDTRQAVDELSLGLSIPSIVSNTYPDNELSGSSSLVTFPSSQCNHTTNAHLPFLTFPLEIRREIYRYVLPHQSGEIVPTKIWVTYGDRFVQTGNPYLYALPFPKGESAGWLNLPCKSMAFLRVNRQISNEAREVMYGEAVYKVRISEYGTNCLGFHLPVAKCLPFPTSPNWQFTRFWDVDLQFDRFNRDLRTRWGAKFEAADNGEKAHLAYDQLTPKASYEVYHIQEGFATVLHEMSKMSALQTVTVRLTCLCSSHGKEWPFMCEIYHKLLCDNLTATCMVPSRALNLVLVPRLQRDAPCKANPCAEFSQFMTDHLKKRADTVVTLSPFQFLPVLQEWIHLKELATRLRPSAEKRDILHKVWVALYFSDKAEKEKQALVGEAKNCFQCELEREELEHCLLGMMVEDPNVLIPELYEPTFSFGKMLLRLTS
ncbi:MAG: hypothetical protein Q9201_004228 [Fulgogasparrea decipioides]